VGSVNRIVVQATQTQTWDPTGKITKAKRAGGVAHDQQAQDGEFKLPYCQKKKKKMGLVKCGDLTNVSCHAGSLQRTHRENQTQRPTEGVISTRSQLPFSLSPWQRVGCFPMCTLPFLLVMQLHNLSGAQDHLKEEVPSPASLDVG
jgi:hypothetical protein